MRLIVRDPKHGKRFHLILPYGLAVNLAVRKIWFRLALSSHTVRDEKILADWQNYLELVDFGELRQVLHELRALKGLTLIEAASADGSYVKISV